MDCGGSFLAPGSSSVAVVISSQLNASECSYIRTSLCAALSFLCLLNSCHLGLSAVSSSQQCQRALPGCPSLVGPCLAAPRDTLAWNLSRQSAGVITGCPSFVTAPNCMMSAAWCLVPCKFLFHLFSLLSSFAFRLKGKSGPCHFVWPEIKDNNHFNVLVY